MSIKSFVMQLVDSLEVCEDEKAVEYVLKQFSHACGVEYFAFLSLCESGTYAISNYPSQWREHYFDKNYMRIDPVVTTAKRVKRAFSWSSVQASVVLPEEISFFKEAGNFGIRSGVSLPVRLAFGRLGLLTLAGSEEHVALGFDDCANEMVVAVATIHGNLKSRSFLPTRRRTIDLSPRRIECLEWASRGKTAAATATILGISESAVAFYLKEARAKLNADNLPHAVRIAMESKFIRREMVLGGE
jgi:LuxR family transcriptional regulator, activator of conjugal transfer of Ti plasmids